MTLLIEKFKEREIVEYETEAQKGLEKDEIKYTVQLPYNDTYEAFIGEDLKGYIVQRILDKAKSRDFDGIDDEYVSDYIKSQIRAMTFNSFFEVEITFTKEEFNSIIKNIVELQLEYFDGLNELKFSDYITYFMS